MTAETPALTYRVVAWDDVHETSRSAKKRPASVRVPTRHDGRGYRRTLAQPNGIQLYAAWVILLSIASQGPRRGVLADESGPLSVDDMAFKTGFPVELLQQALDWFSSPEIRWLTVEPWQPPTPEPSAAAATSLPQDDENVDAPEEEFTDNTTAPHPPPAQPAVQHNAQMAQKEFRVMNPNEPPRTTPFAATAQNRVDKEHLDATLSRALMEIVDLDEIPSDAKIRQLYPAVADRVIAYLRDPCHALRGQAEVHIT